MSRVVINSIPFHTRVSHGAKHILSRDKARAEKLLAGLHAHGPAAFLAKKRASASPPQPQQVPAQGDSTAPKDSIDVIDAGLFILDACIRVLFRALTHLSSGVTYTMPVKVGQPPTTYTLLIDTGASLDTYI